MLTDDNLAFSSESLATRDPFQVMSPRERSGLMTDTTGRVSSCGYHAALTAVQSRLDAHDRDGRSW